MKPPPVWEEIQKGKSGRKIDLYDEGSTQEWTERSELTIVNPTKVFNLDGDFLCLNGDHVYESRYDVRDFH